MGTSEHRRFHRMRPTASARTGTIFVDVKTPTTVCNIIDLSAGGACIEVHGTATIPKRFILNHGGVKKSCRLVWQKGRRIGVSF
jgi:PilZ domain